MIYEERTDKGQKSETPNALGAKVEEMTVNEHQLPEIISRSLVGRTEGKVVSRRDTNDL